MKEIQHLLNKINKVTAYHRHGNKIPTKALDELSNAQIEFEKSFPVQLQVKNANGGQEFLVLQHCIKTTIKGNDLTNDVTASIRKIIANNESEALGYFIKITKEDFPTHSKLTPLAFKIGDIPLFDSRSSR